MARTMQRATTSAHRVFEVLDTEPEVTDVSRPVRLEPVRGQVEFENVTFAYDGVRRSEEHTSELQSLRHLVCRLLLEKKKEGRQMLVRGGRHPLTVVDETDRVV